MGGLSLLGLSLFGLSRGLSLGGIFCCFSLGLSKARPSRSSPGSGNSESTESSSEGLVELLEEKLWGDKETKDGGGKRTSWKGDRRGRTLGDGSDLRR